MAKKSFGKESSVSLQMLENAKSATKKAEKSSDKSVPAPEVAGEMSDAADIANDLNGDSDSNSVKVISIPLHGETQKRSTDPRNPANRKHRKFSDGREIKTERRSFVFRRSVLEAFLATVEKNEESVNSAVEAALLLYIER